MDWSKLAENALADLGGKDALVKGTRLRLEITSRAASEGEDFGTYLSSTGLTFRKFLDQNTRIIVFPRAGTDMLVGFPSAKQTEALPPQQSMWVRDDVYEAFTQISQESYAYVSSSDRFALSSHDNENEIPVPPVNLEDLVENRRAFAEAVPDEGVRSQLLNAVNFSSNPLNNFHRVLGDLRLLPKWHQFNYSLVRRKVEGWAESAGVSVLPGWFEPRPPTHSPQRILAELAQYMSEDEVRSLQIPFRAVEGMLKAVKRQPDQQSPI